jgi:hypothetical protein
MTQSTEDVILPDGYEWSMLPKDCYIEDGKLNVQVRLKQHPASLSSSNVHIINTKEGAMEVYKHYERITPSEYEENKRWLNLSEILFSERI